MFVLFLTFLFLVSVKAMSVMAVLEASTVAIRLMVGAGSFNKETGGAMKYLLVYTIILGLLVLVDLGFRLLDILIYVVGGVLRCSILTFYSKLPVFGVHQWLPKAHVEVTAGASAILRGVMLKFGAPVVGSIVGLELRGLVLSILLTVWGIQLMGWTSDFKVWVAFSSITHMTLMFLVMFKYITVAVAIYLMAHTIMSSAMFWHFSKEYQMRRTRSYYHFGNYGDSWLVYIWLGLPLFITFLIELHLFEKLLYFDGVSGLVYLSMLIYFIVVALSKCHSSVGVEGVYDSENGGAYWLSYVAISWLVALMWFSV